MTAAATAMAISRSVARMGDTPFLEVSFLTKAISPIERGLWAFVFNLYEPRIQIIEEGQLPEKTAMFPRSVTTLTVYSPLDKLMSARV